MLKKSMQNINSIVCQQIMVNTIWICTFELVFEWGDEKKKNPLFEEGAASYYQCLSGYNNEFWLAISLKKQFWCKKEKSRYSTI
jgi:hypothetical protein